jgi:hypothetical protein
MVAFLVFIGLIIVILVGVGKPDAREFIVECIKAVRGGRKVPYISVGSLRNRSERRKDT